MYRKNVASQFICFQMLLTATGAVATGLSPAVRRCIDGTFAAGGGTVTEDGTTGSYKYAMSQADTNGNDISFIFSAATAIPVCVNIVTTAADPTDSVRLGLTSLPNAAAGASGGLPMLDAALTVAANVVDSGTAQAGGAATITLRAGASATDNLYNGSVITIMTGTGAGQSRVVTGYVGSTKVATVGRNWVTQPDNTSVYKMHGLAAPRVDDNLAVIIQAGTGTGQLDFTSGVVKANATQWLGGTIPAVNVTGVPLVDLKYTLGTISPATAGSVRADSVTGAVGSVTGLTASNLDAAVSSRMATYTQPTGFLAATFPSGTVANTTNITAGTITTATNLTNAPTAGDFTATMKTSLNAATPAVTVSDKTGFALTAAYDAAKTAAQASDIPTANITAIKAKTDSLTFTVTGQVDSNVLDWKSATAPAMTGDAYARIGAAGAGLTALGDTRIANLDAAMSTRSAPGDAMTLTGAYDFAKGTVAMTESYAANGVTPTPVQAIYAIQQYLTDFSISGTSYTVKKLNNSTTAYVVTLDSATTPTAAART